ncbi:aminodeoxychorismate synthase component I [Aequorivita echinoideorum]|uniref:aminodeoxychorismate synthase n=1 Tax=Aequorivita echinoideorum TaxID=1549647 RepID=A0ABS5S5G3_9FLAO|nr:aminodeoxychorismate synthase component I [Aequorivita echinoideorum]MBT0608424.1 aminodeoxychorismate synthase component I [Aequorivita echinoideorum]
MRASKIHFLSLDDTLKKKLLAWAQQYNEIIWLDSNAHVHKYSRYEAILAVDAFTSVKTDQFGAFDKLKEYQSITTDWIFGYLTYDLKNDVEKLSSNNFDGLDFPDLYFFQPKKIFLFTHDSVELLYLNVVADKMDSDWQEILLTEIPEISTSEKNQFKICERTTKKTYLKKVNQMLQHINRGDIYEANLCQEFFSEFASIDPFAIFFHFNEISKAPFAAFLKLDHYFALSASPERYLKKEGKNVISQPIKGTAKRHKTNTEDALTAKNLAEDPKERSENIMITDLVRNDLSRFAEKGSVNVDELCKVYTFEQVHQMISTISCTISPQINSVEILRNTFPMGSMTGAPKISAMQIIEELEDSKRGLYSGAIGYFSPEADFDFNVVIRSILYNSNKKYISFSVGGAITASSIAENEYQECLLKANAMMKVLGASFD